MLLHVSWGGSQMLRVWRAWVGRKEQLYKISEWKPVQLRPLGVSLHRLGLNCNYGLVLWAGEGGPKTKHHRDVHPNRPAYGAERRQIRQGCRATRSRRIHYVSFFPGFFFSSKDFWNHSNARCLSWNACCLTAWKLQPLVTFAFEAQK